MRSVQFILVVLIIGFLILYFNRLRSGILDRVVVVVFAIGGVIMVLLPNLTMRAAAAVGVERSVDLFMYLAFLGFGFFGLVLYSKLRSLESSITDLARTFAVQTARRPDADDRNPSDTV